MKRNMSPLTLQGNMKVTIIPIVIDAFGTITKGLWKWLEDLEVGRRVETIQTTAFLRTARILRRVLKTWGDLRRLAINQTPAKNHQLKVMGKTVNYDKSNNNDNNDKWKTVSFHWRTKNSLRVTIINLTSTQLKAYRHI